MSDVDFFSDNWTIDDSILDKLKESRIKSISRSEFLKGVCPHGEYNKEFCEECISTILCIHEEKIYFCVYCKDENICKHGEIISDCNICITHHKTYERDYEGDRYCEHGFSNKGYSCNLCKRNRIIRRLCSPY